MSEWLLPHPLLSGDRLIHIFVGVVEAAEQLDTPVDQALIRANSFLNDQWFEDIGVERKKLRTEKMRIVAESLTLFTHMGLTAAATSDSSTVTITAASVEIKNLLQTNYNAGLAAFAPYVLRLPFAQVAQGDFAQFEAALAGEPADKIAAAWSLLETLSLAGDHTPVDEPYETFTPDPDFATDATQPHKPLEVSDAIQYEQDRFTEETYVDPLAETQPNRVTEMPPLVDRVASVDASFVVNDFGDDDDALEEFNHSDSGSAAGSFFDDSDPTNEREVTNEVVPYSVADATPAEDEPMSAANNNFDNANTANDAPESTFSSPLSPNEQDSTPSFSAPSDDREGDNFSSGSFSPSPRSGFSPGGFNPSGSGDVSSNRDMDSSPLARKVKSGASSPRFMSAMPPASDEEISAESPPPSTANKAKQPPANATRLAGGSTPARATTNATPQTTSNDPFGANSRSGPRAGGGAKRQSPPAPASDANPSSDPQANAPAPATVPALQSGKRPMTNNPLDRLRKGTAPDTSSNPSKPSVPRQGAIDQRPVGPRAAKPSVANTQPTRDDSAENSEIITKFTYPDGHSIDITQELVDRYINDHAVSFEEALRALYDLFRE